MREFEAVKPNIHRSSSNLIHHYTITCIFLVNPFPNIPFCDRSKFKEAVDDDWNVAIKGFYDTDCIENIVGKGEIAHLINFTFSHNVFLKFVSSIF